MGNLNFCDCQHQSEVDYQLEVIPIIHPNPPTIATLRNQEPEGLQAVHQ